MKLHDIFFWLACFFLAGVLIASVTSGLTAPYFPAAAAIVAICATLFIFDKRLLAALGLSMFLGAAFYFFSDSLSLKREIVFDQKVEFTGIIREAEQRISSQMLRVGNARTRIQIVTSRYPSFEYGDEIKIRGVIKSPEGEWAWYFKKEGVAGLVSFPEIELISKDSGSPIMAALFKIKGFFKESFKKVLPFEQAAFMAGLTLGDTSEFSDEFEEKLRASGTSHLVALSGYNISIIVRALAVILGGWWLTKRFKFPLTVTFILAFVVMTGAEASVVRAAIMAGLVLVADQVRRPYHFRNAVAAAALLMVLPSPNILAFDIGFQLSFAALIGIVYLEPWLRKKLKISKDAGVLGWRKNLMTTTSAQLAVLPLLIYHFGFVSPLGILANVLILEFIPITMALGFFMAFASLISGGLAWLISWPANAFLAYEIGIINLCSKILSLLI